MNDFTKAELAIIHLAIMRDINQFSHILTTSPSMIALRDKLETMIETYSELKPPTMANYCCAKCNEEWHQCECKK